MSCSLRCSFAFFLLFATFQTASDAVLHAAADQSLLENIALGKPYTLSRPPGYRLCTDAGDRTQLTDGQFTKGYFWTQESTVGWQGGQPVLISIDLGQVEPIRGVAFSTAAGKAGVRWPPLGSIRDHRDMLVDHRLLDFLKRRSRRFAEGCLN